ncbi:glycosyltransferase [Saliphagus sp. GCM10025308]
MVSASVVVPAKAEGVRLEATLDSLSAQRFDGDLEVVVVANGAETIAVARGHAVVDRVLRDEFGSRSEESRNGAEKTAPGPPTHETAVRDERPATCSVSPTQTPSFRRRGYATTAVTTR